MKTFDIKNIIKTASAFLILASLAFVFSRMNNATAQSSSSTLSGTYVCLTNSNMSGYVAKKTADTNSSQGINQLFTITFNSNTATFGGIVANAVSHFESSTLAATVTTVDSAPSVTATVTANTPSQYIYKLVASSGGVTDYYIGVTNSGNSLFFMSAPTNTSTMNGACQKV